LTHALSTGGHLPGQASTFENLLKVAGQRLYQSKSAGRDRVTVATGQAVVARCSMVGTLSKATAGNGGT
jgi:hypothetical protein